MSSASTPDNWRTVPLKKVVSDFIVPMRDKPKEFRGDIPWCRIEDFEGKYLSDSKSGRYVDETIVKDMNLKIYPPGTVLCSCSAQLGICSITTRPLVTNQTFIGLVPSANLVEDFLYYCMMREANNLQAMSSGTTIAYLPREKFESFEILLPPLSEQQKISTILSSVDRCIELTEATIKKLQDLNKALMLELLTQGLPPEVATKYGIKKSGKFKDSKLGKMPEEWEVVRLEHVVEKFIDYRGKTPAKMEYGIPLITAKNVRQGYIDLSDVEFIAARDYDSWMVRGLPKPNDILFTTEAPLGNVAILNLDFKVALAQRIITLRTKASIYSTSFLKYALLSDGGQKEIREKCSGSTVLGIKQSELRKIAVILPPLEEQRVSAEILRTIENKIEIQEKHNRSLRVLKIALMQDLLTGKVRV